MEQVMNKVLGDNHMGEYTTQISENIIVKYRDARTEIAWKDFMLSMQCAGLCHIPGFVEIISSTDFKHEVKVIEKLDTSPDEIEEYYRSCGVLLCFTWLMGSDDLHEENLIASKDKPYLIDFETLMNGTDSRQSEFFEQSMAGSVTRSHLLPFYLDEVDSSGFSGKNGKNIPQYNGLCFEAQYYQGELNEGFTHAFQFIMNHKELVCQKLHLFDKCSFRILFRPTHIYNKLISYIEGLEDTERELTVNRLLRVAYERDVDPDRINKVKYILDAETYSLVHGWIPLFWGKGDSLDIFCDGRQLGMEKSIQTVMREFYRKSPVESAIQRISDLSESDLEKQLKIIEIIYHSKKCLKSDITSFDISYDYIQSNTNPLVKKQVMRSLQEDKIPGLPQQYIRMTSIGDTAHYISTGWGLYDGLTGILCSLAAMNMEESELFCDAYNSIKTYLIDTAISTYVSDSASGLSQGLSGIISGLLHIADLTGNNKYREDAYILLEGFNEQMMFSNSPDVLTGIGGLCLQLPKLPGEKSQRLAQVILPFMKDADSHLTGAAHGKAGLALALGALQYTLKTSTFDNRIIQLLTSEDSLYDNEMLNWPDLRDDKEIHFMGGWCSGAPGIGMYRKRLMQYTDNREILDICKQDIERSNQYLKCAGELKRDTLCCGNASRLIAAEYLGVQLPNLKQLLLRSADAESAYLYHRINTADHSDSLMQGVAGIGYVLSMSGNPMIGEMLL